jgi:hypothetical protein
MTRRNKALVFALLAAGTFGGQAQAHTVWGTLPKSGVPYAVPHTHPTGGYTVRSASECPRTVIRRSFRSKVTLVCPDR